MLRHALRAFSLSALFALTSAYAQFDHALVAQIPFNFVVGNKLFTAGEYRVTGNYGQSAVLIQDSAHRSASFVLAHAAQAKDTQSAPRLVFHRYGNQFFLYQIWPGWGNTGRELSQSRTERELVRNITKPQTAIVLASEQKHLPGR